MIIQDYKVKEIAFCTYKELLENDYLPVIPNQDVITNFLLKKAEKNPRFGEKMKWENLKNIKQEYDNLYYHNSKGNMYCMRYDVQSKMAILYRIKSPSHYGKYDELYDLKAEYPEADWGYLENEEIDTEEILGLTSYSYLHGFCDIFSKVLKDTMPEYQREAIYDSEGKLIHSYCTIVKDGVRWFADVRGITADYTEFMSEFDDFAQFMNLPDYPVKGTLHESVMEPEVPLLDPSEYDAYRNAAAFIIDEYWDIFKFYCVKQSNLDQK